MMMHGAQNESVTTGDGLEMLQHDELINVLITELNRLRLFWPKFSMNL